MENFTGGMAVATGQINGTEESDFDKMPVAIATPAFFINFGFPARLTISKTIRQLSGWCLPIPLRCRLWS